MLARPARSRRGFSLVEILVVITIIALLMTFGFGAMQNAMEASRVVDCQENLRTVGQGMIYFKSTRNKGKWPRESGIRFLLTLHKTKQLEGRASDCFVCPGTPNVYNDEGDSGEPGSSYDDWESITSASISYAGRDTDAYPIRGGDESEEVLAADDNEYGPNHKTVTNILYAGGEVYPFDLLIDGEEILAEFPEYEVDGIPVGPDSPHEDLQKLSID